LPVDEATGSAETPTVTTSSSENRLMKNTDIYCPYFCPCMGGS
jgi:hypothetical protein